MIAAKALSDEDAAIAQDLAENKEFGIGTKYMIPLLAQYRAKLVAA